MKKNVVIFLALALVLGGMIGMNGCRRPVPPKAIVKIVDTDKQPVENAMVIVKANNSDSAHTMVYFKDETKSVADTQYTTSDGTLEYEFKYESILKVEATKDADRAHPFVRRGMGVLVLENNKTAEVTIEINEQTVFN
ncbi:MAG: hypothetical protein IKO34_04665 [Bacteroidales bacterium]|jgi:hypothetical protein|nr:hypothetical protein [Bacteroidales bacterium]